MLFLLFFCGFRADGTFSMNNEVKQNIYMSVALRCESFMEEEILLTQATSCIIFIFIFIVVCFSRIAKNVNFHFPYFVCCLLILVFHLFMVCF
jgi:hypothetical protein